MIQKRRSAASVSFTQCDELLVLNSVRSQLDTNLTDLWNKQVKAINKIQRLPEGVEVDFYRMKNGHPSFDEDLAFPNKTKELLVAEVEVNLPSLVNLIAKVWCVRGFIFMIEYNGSVKYFEEVASIDPPPGFKINCRLIADLTTSTGDTL